MKNQFRGYVRYTDEEFKTLWETATFSFDANVLLDIYRVNTATAAAFQEAVQSLKDRIWLTHQAGMEFFEHYQDEIRKPAGTYKAVEEHLGKMKSVFGNTFPRHPYIPLETFADRIGKVADELIAELKKLEAGHQDLTKSDPSLALLLNLFEDRIGNPPSADELKAWHAKAADRYKRSIPPGWKDVSKTDENERYGDAVLWFELIEYAQKKKTPIIFVTNDNKEDWWEEIGGKTIGPQPQLLQEFHEQCKVPFYMYNAARFIEQKGVQDRKPPEPKVISDLEALEQQKLNQQRIDYEHKRRVASRIVTRLKAARNSRVAHYPNESTETPLALADFARRQPTVIQDVLNQVQQAREHIRSTDVDVLQERLRRAQQDLESIDVEALKEQLGKAKRDAESIDVEVLMHHLREAQRELESKNIQSILERLRRGQG